MLTKALAGLFMDNGGSDAGKTKWARACLAAAGYKNPLVVSQLDGFKRFKKGVHDSIICDEINFKVPFLVNEDGTSARNPNAVDCETAKNILEFEEPRDIQARTKPAYKPAGIPIVFCTNDDTGDIFPSGRSQQDSIAIQRRFKKREVRGSLYPYAKNDRQLKEEGAFSELHARKVTRLAFRNVRQAARDGHLTLGGKKRPREEDSSEASSETSSSIITSKLLYGM